MCLHNQAQAFDLLPFYNGSTLRRGTFVTIPWRKPSYEVVKGVWCPGDFGRYYRQIPLKGNDVDLDLCLKNGKWDIQKVPTCFEDLGQSGRAWMNRYDHIDVIGVNVVRSYHDMIE